MRCLSIAFALVVEGIKVLPKYSLNLAEMVSGIEELATKYAGISLKRYKIRNLSVPSFIHCSSLLPCQTGLIGVFGD